MQVVFWIPCRKRNSFEDACEQKVVPIVTVTDDSVTDTSPKYQLSIKHVCVNLIVA